MQVYAKTDESDTGFIRVGAESSFQVDALPGETFRGRVSAVRLNAYAVQNVVTYDTIIDFDNDELKLFPGMTAYVTIPVATVQKSSKVPNTALRFRPSLPAAEVRALYAKYGIDDGAPQSPLPNAGAPPAGEPAVVWKLRADKTLEPLGITIGITDHAYTEVVAVNKGSLDVDDNIVTASVESKSQQGSR
jgi:HlyD family secretion protein